jgi:hypothetical protein
VCLWLIRCAHVQCQKCFVNFNNHAFNYEKMLSNVTLYRYWILLWLSQCNRNVRNTCQCAGLFPSFSTFHLLLGIMNTFFVFGKVSSGSFTANKEKKLLLLFECINEYWRVSLNSLRKLREAKTFIDGSRVLESWRKLSNCTQSLRDNSISAAVLECFFFF